MLCANCGAELSNNAKYCSHCGVAVSDVKSPTKSVKRIQIKCNSCNGVMDIDKERPILLCPYCGSKELIIESDKVTAQRIKSSIYKEVEFEKQRTYREVELGKRELEIKGDKSRFIQRLIGFGIVIVGIVITHYSFWNVSVIGLLIGIVVIIGGVSLLKHMKRKK